MAVVIATSQAIIASPEKIHAEDDFSRGELYILPMGNYMIVFIYINISLEQIDAVPGGIRFTGECFMPYFSKLSSMEEVGDDQAFHSVFFSFLPLYCLWR